MKAVVIDNDKQIKEHIKLALTTGWPDAHVVETHRGIEGIDLIENHNPDVVIIGCELPDCDEFDLVKDVRLFSDTLIVMLSSKLDQFSIAKGIESGADEYLSRSFGELELIYRLKAMLRRLQSPYKEFPLISNRFNLYSSTNELTIGNNKINLTRSETIILKKLMSNINNIVTYQNLASEIWGDTHPDYYNAIRIHIWHLRSKLKANHVDPKIIETRPMVGYILKE